MNYRQITTGSYGSPRSLRWVLKWAVPLSVSAVLVAGVMTALALEAQRQAVCAEAAQRRALVQESLARRQARRAMQAESRA